MLSEHQKFVERSQRELSKNNLFISGIPNAAQPNFQNTADVEDESSVTNHVDIIHHALDFVSPGIIEKLQNFGKL